MKLSTIKTFIRTQKALSMLARNSTTLALNLTRNKPELVGPTRPTPNELKQLSDLDNLDILRYQQPIILAYPAKEGGNGGKDPAKVIKAALGEALVYYYPWAGRLRVGPGGRLGVDCTAEGVVFVEADADARLDQFGEESMVPPFPCVDQLLYNRAADTFAVVGCPMFTIQVTRLLCGGFIVAFNFSHAMSDGIGVVKFLTTVAEISQGASSPSILPVWRRTLMNARDPPHTTSTLPNNDNQQTNTLKVVSQHNLVSRTFIFDDREISALRARIPQHLHPSTTFELVSACIWHCRTIALQYPPQEQVTLAFPVSIRDKLDPPLPDGYYGNACAVAICASQASEIRDNSFGYTLELVKKAKGVIKEEYVESSLVDLAVSRGRRLSSMPNNYNLSDVSSGFYGFSRLDFGWGKPGFAGPPDNGFASSFFSFVLGYGNGKGKVVSVSLPVDAMDRFVKVLGSLLT